MVKIHLSRLLGERRMSRAELSRRTGISEPNLVPLYHERVTSIRLETIDKLCEALDCTVGDLLEYMSIERPLNK